MKRGRKPIGELPMTGAERMRRHRAARRAAAIAGEVATLGLWTLDDYARWLAGEDPATENFVTSPPHAGG